MADTTRQDEIRGIHLKYKWLYQLLGGTVLLVIGIAIGAKIGESKFNDRSKDYQLNLFTEAIGVVASIGFTVLIVDRMSERRTASRLEEQLQKDLVRSAGSRSNDIAISAIEQLRDKKWLFGAYSLLEGSNLEQANLENVDLSYANLSSANMFWVRLELADVNYADLQGAYLEGSSMAGVSLFQANLKKAVLNYAHMQNADFRLADMRSAQFHSARMQGVDFTGAFLEGAIWVNELRQPAELIDATLPDGTGFSQHSDLDRFTNPKHPDFPRTLEEVKKRRAELTWDE